MFQSARRLFRLTPAAPTQRRGEMPSRPASQSDDDPHRHPAMRGLNVAPVHGRHCICDRCTLGRAA